MTDFDVVVVGGGTGSVPRAIPGLDIGGKKVVTCDHGTNSTAEICCPTPTRGFAKPSAKS